MIKITLIKIDQTVLDNIIKELSLARLLQDMYFKQWMEIRDIKHSLLEHGINVKERSHNECVECAKSLHNLYDISW